MADYYSLLARAVANLPKTSPASTRRAIYDRARKALTNQLRSLKPQLPESDIAREERALDDAVARLEAEFEPVAAPAELRTLPLASATADLDEAPPPPPPPAAPPRPPRVAETPTLRPVAPRAMPPAAPLRAPLPPRAPSPARPPPPSPSPSLGGLPNAAPFKGPLLGGAETQTDTAPASAPPALSGASRVELAGVPSAAAPRAEIAGASRVPSENPSPALGAPRPEQREPTRPVLSDMRPKARTWMWVAGAVALGFAVSVAAVAFLMRPTLRDIQPPVAVDAPPATPPSVVQEKSLRRIGRSAETPDPSAPETAATPGPQPSTQEPSPPATTPVAPPPETAANPIASPAPATTPPAPPATTAIPVASRAAMLVATVADAAKPAISVGSAVWSLVPAPAGQPAAIGVKADMDVPDLKMHASIIFRKNFDNNLPATHTIDLRVTFDAGSSIKGVKDIALPLMRRDDPPAADALTGVRVKISDNYFLIGLNRSDADVARNVQEMGERNWFDFPMQLDDDRIAKLTFEKGADGERLFAQALAAWK